MAVAVAQRVLVVADVLVRVALELLTRTKFNVRGLDAV